MSSDAARMANNRHEEFSAPNEEFTTEMKDMRHQVRRELFRSVQQSWRISALCHALGQQRANGKKLPRWHEVPIRTLHLAQQSEAKSSGKKCQHDLHLI